MGSPEKIEKLQFQDVGKILDSIELELNISSEEGTEPKSTETHPIFTIARRINAIILAAINKGVYNRDAWEMNSGTIAEVRIDTTGNGKVILFSSDEVDGPNDIKGQNATAVYFGSDLDKFNSGGEDGERFRVGIQTYSTADSAVGVEVVVISESWKGGKKVANKQFYPMIEVQGEYVELHGAEFGLGSSSLDHSLDHSHAQSLLSDVGTLFDVMRAKADEAMSTK